jgi:CHASE2 domain-containing sensor protein
VVFAFLHALGVMPIGVLQRLDDIIYDARLRWTMPRTLDERIVIVDIDEKSLAEVGRPVVLGYYFTSDRDGRTSGLLPEPVMLKESLRGRPIKVARMGSSATC